MAKQTRRSISVRGTTYDSLRRYSETHERAMSDIVEELLAKLLDAPDPPAIKARTVAPRVVRARKPSSGSAGRPAPTPAAAVQGTQRPSAPKGDYRTIRF
jgi:hypothetical protein